MSAIRKVSAFHRADYSCEVGLWEVISPLGIDSGRITSGLPTIRELTDSVKTTAFIIPHRE